MYRPLAITWRVFDGSVTPPTLIALGRGSTNVRVKDETLLRAVLEGGNIGESSH